ncbi:MAG: glutamine synthetase [Planctomycetota bacterium]|nr:MAG: glutamine synthetase [Planctomycetota bacterium]
MFGDNSQPFEHDVRPLVRAIGKSPEQWQRADLLDYCLKNGIQIVNFRYTALDGKLKELRLPVNSFKYLEKILTAGERVDGSSLFPGLFPTTESDLYVLPVYRWAFINPWAPDELEIVCRYANREGKPAPTPDNVLANACQSFREVAKAELHALAELEFYVITNHEDERFSGRPQRNYHQSSPYLHSRPIVDEITRVVSQVTGNVKYCHSEVGYIDRIESSEKEIDGRRVEQYELEFDLMPMEDLGCWLTVARWLVREIANRHGASVTYLPKLDEGMAGSGMHLHLAIMRDGVNVMQEAPGELSEDALKLIGGILENAPSLTAFGSTVAASYLRLVPGQEAPTKICWGYQNRASLVRVPLSFACKERLDTVVNPNESGDYPQNLARPTVEYRSPDGSAFPQLLLAAVTQCAAAGLASKDSLELAKKLAVPRGTAGDLSHFEQLPATAVAAGRQLERSRTFYEEHGLEPRLIDLVITKLEDEEDLGLSEKLKRLPAAERLAASRKLMHKDLHKH